MKRLLLASLLTVLSMGAFAADDFTLWESQTFTGPFTGGVVATSSSIGNTSGTDSIKIHVNFEAVTHTGTTSNVCPCDIRAIIEEEIHAGIWIPIASQFSEYRILDSSPQRVLILTPAPNYDGASDENILLADGSELRLSRSQGSAPSTFRVRITVQEYSVDALQSITITGYGRKFAG